MAMPLDGIRIVECASWGVGPIAAAMLSDLGVEVIKVEEPWRWRTRTWVKRTCGLQYGCS